MIICIDPGHGGKDCGAFDAKSELVEKHLNLDLAFTIGDILSKRFDIIYTREMDCYVSNSERIAIANNNNNKVNLYLAIHHNSAESQNANGLEVLYYPYSSKGKELASELTIAITKNWTIKNRGIKEGWYRGQPGKYLTVLQKTKMTAVLLEAAFISSPIDRVWLVDQRARNLFYKHIANCINDVFLEWFDLPETLPR